MFDAPEMLAVCDGFDQASIARSPLGLGLLTGKYTTDSTFLENDWRQSDYFREEWIIPILGKLDAVRDILTSGGRTLAQGALAWIWARSECTIPIPGFRTAAQVEENARAMEFGPLDEEQVRQVDELLGRESVTSVS
jgi:aryl-alcohol dehydrogenase-like predicted oxidoreductase